MLRSELAIEVEQNPVESDEEYLTAQLVHYNSAQAGPDQWKPLAIFLRDQKRIIQGGLTGYTHWYTRRLSQRSSPIFSLQEVHRQPAGTRSDASEDRQEPIRTDGRQTAQGARPCRVVFNRYNSARTASKSAKNLRF
jgi:hypothetical protein